MHIGQRIKEVMKEQHVTVVSVAQALKCERTNLYNIFARKDINTQLLQRLSLVLKHDFFKELSADTFPKANKKSM